MRSCVILLVIIISVCSCDNKGKRTETYKDSLALAYTVLNTFPHSSEAFTEGLVIYKTKLLESTGLNNQSWIGEVNRTSGELDKKVVLDEQYFGEGITVLNNKIYHLTYKEKTGFVYDATTYKKIGEFKYNMEGWGLTHNSKNLIMSDGTNKLYFLDTTNLNVVQTLSVLDVGNRKVKNLNELEYIDHYIFANVYESNQIVKIDPATGKVVGRLDLSALTNEIKAMYPNTYELNGIAYDQNAKALLITGKYWPKFYLIKVR